MNKKLELGLGDKLVHHWLTIFIATLGTMFLYFSTIRPPKPTQATMGPTSLIIIGLIFFSLAVLTYFWLESKLNFSEIKVTLDKEIIAQRIIETATRSKWIPTGEFSKSSRTFEFIQTNLFRTSNVIVVKVNDEKVLVNARGNYPIDTKIVSKLATVLTNKD